MSISVSGTGGSGGSSDTPDKQRVNLIFNANQGRAPGYAFNPAAIAAPENGTFGSGPPVDFIGPGLYNWDLSLRRRFQLGEKTKLFFEVQTYNAFNRPEYHAVESTAHFTNTAASGAPPVYVLDAANNPLFGQYTSAYPARQLQLALRLTF